MMSDQPHEIQLPLAEFDRSKLPPHQRNLLGEAFALAVRDHMQQEFTGAPGSAHIAITKDTIIIRWDDADTLSTPTERGIDNLKAGDYDTGIRFLELALARDPEDASARFNLAMALSDQDRLPEAISHLELLIARQPEHVGAWNALGVAKARARDIKGAIKALEQAYALDPIDGYVLKNLGGLMVHDESDLDAAATYLTLASHILPEDPQVWLSLGRLHEKLSETGRADTAYLRVIELEPAGELGQEAKTARSRIVESNFHKCGDIRPDATQYCLDALQKFNKLSKHEVQQITFEIAMLGTRGLDVNSPEKKYSIRTMPGSFSGLHLLCIEYVGFQSIDPSIDIQFDLAREYAAAKQLFEAVS
jgi:tetratricopeptide (TPR) repeat protein